MKICVALSCALFFSKVLFAQEIDSHSCEYLEERSECRDYGMLEYYLAEDYRLLSRWTEQSRCHFQNQITTYVYAKGESLFLDLKNAGEFGAEDATYEFESCSEVEHFLEEIAEWQAEAFQPVGQRDFVDRSSVLIVASEPNCHRISGSLQSLLSHYKKEGRASSRLLCVPQSIMETRNPSEVRASIHREHSDQSLILLVGSDLPTFELYDLSTHQGSLWVDHGASDLPYGSNHPFWDQPEPKNQAKLLNRVYHERNNLFLLSEPTPYTFDTQVLSQDLMKSGSLRQFAAVSRWIEHQNMEEEFENFVRQRKKYTPPQSQNFIFASGGEGVLFRAGEHQRRQSLEAKLGAFIRGLGRESRHRVLTEASLDGVLNALDRQTTLLLLNEHGSPSAIGDLHAGNIKREAWLPPILILKTCFGGAWMRSSSLRQVLISSVTNTRHPPIATLAPKGLLWTSYFKERSTLSAEGWLQSWRPGTSLGQHQRTSLEHQAQFILEDLPYFLENRRSAHLNQLLTAVSIFGDATAEL